jgi:hypothetical protein
MIPIKDNDLILYHYRDGLDADRLAEIDAALSASDALRDRYAGLRDLLGAADAVPVPALPADFERRLWERLSPHLATTAPVAGRANWRERLRNLLPPMTAPRVAWAAAFGLVLALGAGFLVGRHSLPEPDATAQAQTPTMAARVLDRYVAEHLRATEGVLLTAVNSDSSELLGGNRELASALVDSNRLYALAAARSGNTRLADFLRQLEPVLLDLANQPASSSIQSVEGLRDYLRDTDLLFQVRATEARIDAASKRSL